MITKFEFSTPINCQYFRNNRTSGQKSVRCFPCCSTYGHVKGGFCGTPVKVTMQLYLNGVEMNRLMFVAEMRSSLFPKLSSSTVIRKEDLYQNIRSKIGCKNGELFMGEVNCISEDKINGTIDIEIIFNAKKCSWDYSWESTRWKGTKVSHVIDIICLEESDNSEYFVKECITSSEFFLLSSHKKAAVKDDFSQNVGESTEYIKSDTNDYLLANESMECLELKTKKRKGPKASQKIIKKNPGLFPNCFVVDPSNYQYEIWLQQQMDHARSTMDHSNSSMDHVQHPAQIMNQINTFDPIVNNSKLLAEIDSDMLKDTELLTSLSKIYTIESVESTMTSPETDGRNLFKTGNKITEPISQVNVIPLIPRNGLLKNWYDEYVHNNQLPDQYDHNPNPSSEYSMLPRTPEKTSIYAKQSSLVDFQKPIQLPIKKRIEFQYPIIFRKNLNVENQIC